MAKGDCADCGGFDVEWMYRCQKHNVQYCRGCSCPDCDDDFLDSCDDDWSDDYYDENYSEPPLYWPGQIAAMSDAELIAEARRQCSIHDSAVDRCEPIGAPVIERAAAKLETCSTECKRRNIEWLWPDDESSETVTPESSNDGKR